MKRVIIKSLLMILILPFFLFAQEVIYLEQNITTSGMEMGQPLDAITKSWISEEKVRIEQPGQTMLLLFDEKKILTLLQKEKQYVEMSFEEMDQILNLSNMLMQASGSQEIVFNKTDQIKKINNRTAYQLTAKTETSSMEMWLSEEVKIDRSAMIKMYRKMPGMSALVSSMEKSMHYPGFPVLTKVELDVMGMEIKTSIELIKAEKRKLEEDLFKVPDDFLQIENPLKMMEEEN
ncbi:MAG: DUF4412 domain-containing protein [Calditrichaeota bacterium]|nr:MAG: DUF4412 domain-containing protein [Calditrichota bacterium]MBL1204923.1 DUF4412 domain-containing protein [Calditrichota bacterium]NOG44752.1 DUF4412 domain-containing protein [Calditrichota bacterium]